MIQRIKCFVRIISLGLVLAGANGWANIVLTSDFPPGVNAWCSITDLTDSGIVLGQCSGGGMDYNPLLVWLPSEGYGLMHEFDAPWSDTGTAGLDVSDDGDVLFLGYSSNTDPSFYGSLTGLGILHTRTWTWDPDSTGSMLVDWGPIHTQLRNAHGQFIGTVPLTDPGSPATINYVLYDPVPAPEPSCLLLLGTIAVPTLIRLRTKRR